MCALCALRDTETRVILLRFSISSKALYSLPMSMLARLIGCYRRRQREGSPRDISQTFPNCYQELESMGAHD